MPPLKPVDRVIRLDHHYSIGTDTTTGTRLFFQYVGTVPTSPAITGWLDTVESRWINHMRPLYPASTILTQLVATDLSSPTSAFGSKIENLAGTRTGVALPASVTLNMNYKISRRYRGGHSRSYWPFGVDTDATTQQQWAPAFITEAFAAIEGYINDLTGSFMPPGLTTFSHVTVSYFSKFDDNGDVIPPNDGTEKPRPIPKVDVIQARPVDPRYGAQRRRVK